MEAFDADDPGDQGGGAEAVECVAAFGKGEAAGPLVKALTSAKSSFAVLGVEHAFGRGTGHVMMASTAQSVSLTGWRGRFFRPRRSNQRRWSRRTLTRSSQRRSRRPCQRAGEASRVLAVGDIHGCAVPLDALLQSVAPTPADQFIFLGDFIDRGPDSAGVISRLIRLSKAAAVSAIQGNHEQMMRAARGSHGAQSEWIRNGGDATLRSYAGMRGTLRDVPADHWRFLDDQLVDYVETDSHLFVHANACPDLAMAEQPDYVLRWERCDTIAAHKSGKVIVCGHTPQKTGRPLNKGFAICLDTYAYGGGLLTCMDAVSGKLWRADARGRVETAHIDDFAEE